MILSSSLGLELYFHIEDLVHEIFDHIITSFHHYKGVRNIYLKHNCLRNESVVTGDNGISCNNPITASARSGSKLNKSWRDVELQGDN